MTKEQVHHSIQQGKGIHKYLKVFFHLIVTFSEVAEINVQDVQYGV